MNANMVRKTAQILFYVNTVIWLGFGMASLVRMRGNDTAPMITLFIVAILMFGNASAMLIAGITIGKGNRLYYYLAITLLFVNIFLTFTDQFGILDLITLIIDVFALGIIIFKSRAFLQPA
jgi:hypothetical protein